MEVTPGPSRRLVELWGSQMSETWGNGGNQSKFDYEEEMGKGDYLRMRD